MLSNNFNPPVSVGLQCFCFKIFALKCLQSRDGGGVNLQRFILPKYQTKGLSLV